MMFATVSLQRLLEMNIHAGWQSKFILSNMILHLLRFWSNIEICLKVNVLDLSYLSVFDILSRKQLRLNSLSKNQLKNLIKITLLNRLSSSLLKR